MLLIDGSKENSAEAQVFEISKGFILDMWNSWMLLFEPQCVRGLGMS